MYQDVEGQTFCSLCEAGTFSSSNAGACTECPVGTYSGSIGSAVCIDCPAQKISNPRSTYEGQCVNPSSNFAFAYIALVVLICFGCPYIFFDAFREAFVFRMVRVYQPLGELMSVLDKEIVRRVNFNCSQIIKDTTHSIHHLSTYLYMLRKLRVFAFFILSTFGTGIVVIFMYVLTCTKLMYYALIVWKGINVNVPNVENFYKKLERLMDSLSVDFGLYWLRELLYPFQLLVDGIASINIDFNQIDVTCAGSQAPLELLVNLLILGLTVFVISTHMNLFYLIFGQINLKVASGLWKSHPDIKSKHWLIFTCYFQWFVVFLNPTTKLLQFAMTLLTFSKFVEKDGYMHESTAICDSVDPSTPMSDTVAAALSTLLAYFIIPAVIYRFSEILVIGDHSLPRDLQIDYKIIDENGCSDKECCSLDILRYTSFFSPDLLMAEQMLQRLRYLYERLQIQCPKNTPHWAVRAISKNRDITKDEKQAWGIVKDKDKHLPGYFGLCFHVWSSFGISLNDSMESIDPDSIGAYLKYKAEKLGIQWSTTLNTYNCILFFFLVIL